MRNNVEHTDNVSDVVVDAPRSGAKRKSATLTAGGEALTILALRRPAGTGTVFVTQTNLKTKKTERGMTQHFDTFALATEALDELAKDAQKRGWQRRERSGGFKPRPDAFTAMPLAPSAPTAKGKK